MSWLKQYWFKVGILVILFLVSLGVLYYYLIFLPHREQKAEEETNLKADLTKEILDTCLNNADDSAFSQFYILCISDKSIGGSKDKCLTGDNQTAFEYMNSSKYYHPVFNDVLNKREKDREECINKYK